MNLQLYIDISGYEDWPAVSRVAYFQTIMNHNAEAIARSVGDELDRYLSNPLWDPDGNHAGTYRIED